MGKKGTLQTIEQKVASVASTFSGWSYVYEGYYNANEVMSRKSLPCILNIMPESGRLIQQGTQALDETNAVIAFCDKMPLDYDGKETDGEIIERLKRCAQAFIYALNESNLFATIQTPVNYSVMFDKLDCNVAIVAIELTLRETFGIPLCISTTKNDIMSYGE